MKNGIEKLQTSIGLLEVWGSKMVIIESRFYHSTLLPCDILADGIR